MRDAANRAQNHHSDFVGVARHGAQQRRSPFVATWLEGPTLEISAQRCRCFCLQRGSFRAQREQLGADAIFIEPRAFGLQGNAQPPP